MSSGIVHDVRHAIGVLRRFEPHAARNLVLVGGLAFLSGAAESAILALVTSVALDTTELASRSGGLGSAQRLWLAGALLVTTFLIGLLLSKLTADIAASSSQRARQQLLTAFHEASYQRKSRDRVATLQEALTTYVDRFTTGFMALLGLLSALLSLVSYAFMAVVIDVRTALALVVVGGLLVFVQRPATRKTKLASRALVGRRGEYARGATESVLLARELAVFGSAPAARDRLLELDADVAHQYRQTKFLAAMTPRIYQTVAFALVIGGLAAVSTTTTSDLTGVAAVALILLRSLSYGQALLASAQQVAEYRPYLDSLTGLLDSYRQDRRHLGTRPLEELRTIRFRQVGFAYEPDRPILHDIDLDIRPGETLGVIGPSGSGKTTFINLLLRLYEPTTGTIEVNGIQLAEVEETAWHRRVAIVPQEPRLLHASIADNIRFLRPLDDASVRRGAEAASIATFVTSLPGGYDAMVGELGSGLSGGQRQRICIARALAGRPDLLVLDEPTSALDGESERAVQTTLEALSGSVTMVLVAHRLSTLSICDHIAVIDAGRLVAFGTPDELRRTSAYFRDALGHAGLT